MKYYELNLDGLVGPTHLFSGLSYGNVASETHKGSISHPRAAALQGLEKMKFLADLGIKQAVMPPQPRPELQVLRAQGYQGSDQEVLQQAFEQDYELFCSVCSSSFMWTANAATVSSSLEASSLNFTPANLSSKFHRSIEAARTTENLKLIFPQAKHHAPLRADLKDEGAANHTRLAPSHSKPGIDFFVYGYSIDENLIEPKKFPARQAKEASQTIILNHGLDPARVVLAQQSTRAIDAGVFHNDVISTGNCNLLLYHEFSFENQTQVIEELHHKYKTITGEELISIEVKNSEVSLEQAIKSYLFNSQIISLPTGGMLLLAAIECEEEPQVKTFIDKLVANPHNPITQVKYFNLRESMHNGGGPACLRLRVVMSEAELAAMNQNYLLTERLYEQLRVEIEASYPEALKPEDLVKTRIVGLKCL